MRHLVLLVLVIAGYSAAPQDPIVEPETLARAQRLAQPGEPHRLLARLQGAWDVAVRTTLPGQPERNERGSVVATAILGGRYVVLNYKFAFRSTELEGVQILGYDNLRQEYSGSWRDDHSTWAVECRGNADEEMPERVQLRGVLSDARDPTGRPFRLVLTLPAADGDAVVVSLHDTMDGAEFLLQTQQWTRK